MKIGSISFSLFLYTSKINNKGESPIYCKLRSNNEIKLCSTGVIITPALWNKNKQSISDINTPEYLVLESWKNKMITCLINSFNSETTVINLEQIVLEVRGEKHNPASNPIGWLELCKLYRDKKLQQVGTTYAQSTVQKFETLCHNLDEFISTAFRRKDIPINEVRLSHLLQYEEHFKIVKLYKQATVNKSIQHLKQIMRYALGHDYIKKDPWLLHKSKHSKTNIQYLKEDELNKIRSLDQLSDKLEKVRDCFIFSCFTGLAYNELKHLNKDMVVHDGGILWINMVRKKTDNVINTPILPPARKIWEKYDGILPVISNQKYNQYLKEIGSTLGIQTPLTSHLARKTFATTVLIANNIPIKIVSSLLGHRNSIITEKHYASVPNETVKQHVKSLCDSYK